MRSAIHTSAFRISILFTLVATLATGLSMFTIYQTAKQEIYAQIDSRLYTEGLRLQRQYESENTTMEFNRPITGIVQRVPSVFSMAYCLIDNSGANTRISHIKKVLIANTTISDLCVLPTILAEEPNQTNVAGLSNSFSGEHLMRAKIITLNNNHILIVGYDSYSEQIILRKILALVSFVTVLLILASFFGSFIVSLMIANPVQMISRTARRIVDGDFSERIPITEKDPLELQKLSGNLNHMLDKLENLIISQRQVTNNIAHDLRSPLNRLRSRMEVALLDRNRSKEELREVVGTSIEDVEALLKTFNALLNIAQVESRARDDFEEIDLTALTNDLAEMYEVLNEEGTHTFNSQIEDHLWIIGNFQLVAQAVTNLIDNAVKYTCNQCVITLTAYSQDGRIVICVADEGNGIPEHERKRVLKRFVRLDSARSTLGNGLGLSLVNAVMNLHDGTVDIKDNHPGVKFELNFPDKNTFLDMHARKKGLNS